MFYPSLFVRREGLPDGFDRSDIKKALEMFCDTYDENDTQEQWFARIKEIAASLGCRAALLTSGHQTRETLAGCGAVLIDSLAEVPALL